MAKALAKRTGCNRRANAAISGERIEEPQAWVHPPGALGVYGAMSGLSRTHWRRAATEEGG